jgi:signal transduction histidine kinase
MKLTDEELLEELKSRFQLRNEMLVEQKKLLEDLEIVNQKLVKSEKLKSDFLSNIKNEINNPITSMLGLLRVVMNNPDSPKNPDLTRLIYREAFTLNFHLQNVFFAAEIEAGQMKPSYSHVDMAHLIQDQIKELNEIYEDKNLQVITDFQLNGNFATDRPCADIIISNVVSNALKFSHEEGEVKVACKIEDGKLVITVEDKGIGMDSASIKRAFDRFVQLDTGTTKNYGGHGLGLSVVQSLVDFLGGQIEIESEKNQGTHVRIELPEGYIADEDVLFDEDDDVFFDDADNVDVF